MNDIRDAAQHALELTPQMRERARDTVGLEHIYVYFRTMYEAAAAEAARPVIEKWSGRLGGVETLGINHTLTMYHSLRLDRNVEPHVVFFPPSDGARTATTTTSTDGTTDGRPARCDAMRDDRTGPVPTDCQPTDRWRPDAHPPESHASTISGSPSPDLDQAREFFEDVLGFEYLYKLGPLRDDEATG